MKYFKDALLCMHMRAYIQGGRGEIAEAANARRDTTERLVRIVYCEKNLKQKGLRGVVSQLSQLNESVSK